MKVAFVLFFSAMIVFGLGVYYVESSAMSFLVELIARAVKP